MQRKPVAAVILTVSLFVLPLFSHLSLVAAVSPQIDNQQYPHRPKLIVILVIDQFRFDYLMRFRAQFVEGGFNLLRTMKNVRSPGIWHSNASAIWS